MTDIVTINQLVNVNQVDQQVNVNPFQNQVIIDSTTNNVEVRAVGQQGIAGGSKIGDKPIVITSVQDLDVLQKAWALMH